MGDVTKEQVKKHFNDKIDWKFFNYLKYCLTKYEDMGLSVEITVATYKSGNVSRSAPAFPIDLYQIYVYRNMSSDVYFDGEYLDDEFIKYDNFITYGFHSAVKLYPEKGLIYIVTVEDKMDEYTNDVKSKANLLRMTIYHRPGIECRIFTPK